MARFRIPRSAGALAGLGAGFQSIAEALQKAREAQAQEQMFALSLRRLLGQEAREEERLSMARTEAEEKKAEKELQKRLREQFFGPEAVREEQPPTVEITGPPSQPGGVGVVPVSPLKILAQRIREAEKAGPLSREMREGFFQATAQEGPLTREMPVTREPIERQRVVPGQVITRPPQTQAELQKAARGFVGGGGGTITPELLKFLLPAGMEALTPVQMAQERSRILGDVAKGVMTPQQAAQEGQNLGITLSAKDISSAMAGEQARAVEKFGAVETVKEGIRRGRKLPRFIQEMTNAQTVGEAEDRLGLTVPTLDSPELRALAKQSQDTKQAITMIDSITGLVQKNPEAFGFTGAAVSLGAGIIAQVRNVISVASKALGVGLESPREQARALAELPEFQALAVANRELVSQVHQLSFLLAASEGLRGRELTDRKIELMRLILGAAGQDPQAFVQVLGMVRGTRIQGLQDAASATFQGPVQLPGALRQLQQQAPAPAIPQPPGIPQVPGMPSGLPPGVKRVRPLGE